MKTRIATLFLLGVAWGCGGSTRPAVGDAAVTPATGDAAATPANSDAAVSPATGDAVVTPANGDAAAADTVDKIVDQPSKVQLALSSRDQSEQSRLTGEVAALSGLTASDLATRHSVTHSPLGYDPSTATNLNLITASTLSLSAQELAVLGQQGFVIARSQEFPSFVYGYSAIYASDLPLFVSADSILDAIHRSYDSMLEQFETSMLISDLQSLLQQMRTALAASSEATAQVRSDVDLYLAVPLALLTSQTVAPVAGASSTDINTLVQAATNAQGIQSNTLFGVERDIDMSQFEPRGHYADTPVLGQYFRAMMWLGRIEFRLIETQSDGSQVFYRRQADAMLLLSDLLGPDGLALWNRIEGVIRKFVGDADNMTPAQVSSLMTDLGITSLVDAARIDDTTMAQAIVTGGYGAQRIASQLMINGTASTLPLNRSFLVFGQRYVVDSEVFSNLVYDRVGHGTIMRMMPNPLDIAYAALGNDDALALLSDELAKYPYAPDLEAMRTLVDEHGDDYWNSTLYTGWLGALRALSPSVGGTPAVGSELPAVALTEGWGRRLVNTQLGSWSELRHDTILYAKQSYTMGVMCQFPDAYVDPYPDLFRRLQQFAQEGSGLAALATAAGQSAFASSISSYFDTLASATGMLADMAAQELTGTQFTQAQMDFINQTVQVTQSMVCGGGPTVQGWYPKLFFAGNSTDYDPAIADVHTEYTDETGNVVGRVLHVGAADPRLMIVTANTYCSGPSAYAGLAFSYHELVTENFQRLTDQDWKTMIATAPPADVPWLAPVLGP
ncbi:MAG: DUF3160 domain-containing protein [Polyangia bacterium]